MPVHESHRLTAGRPAAVVLVVAVTPGLIERIGTIVGRASVRLTVDSIEIREAAADGAPALILYEAGALPHEDFLEVLGALKVSQPQMPVLVSWKGDRASLPEVVRIVRAVRTAIPVYEPTDLKRELLRAIAAPDQPHVGARAFLHLAEMIGDASEMDHLVAAAVLLSNSRLTVEDLATSVSTNARAMSRHCRSAKLPPPVKLLGWAHALHIISALERGKPSLQRVAADAGDTTARACSDYVRYHTGRAPLVWLQSSGFDGLLKDFGQLVRQRAS